MDKFSAHYTIPYNHHCCHTHIQYCYCLNSWLFANTSCPQHHQRHYWFHILWKTLHLPWVSEMLYVTTHFLASEIIIFVVTEIHSSCNLLGQTILQHSNEKGIYSLHNFCSSSFCLFHVPFSVFVVYQNAFWLSSYHLVSHTIPHLIGEGGWVRC